MCLSFNHIIGVINRNIRPIFPRFYPNLLCLPWGKNFGSSNFAFGSLLYRCLCFLSVSFYLWQESYFEYHHLGFVKWYSRLYRNQGSLIFAPPRLDWSEQVVILTGGSSGIGELLANTLAVRNVTVVVLDIKPIITENRMFSSMQVMFPRLFLKR